jgi:hypothetical protein
MTMDESGPYRPYQPYQPYPSGQAARVAAPPQSRRDKALLNSPITHGLAHVLPLVSALMLVVATWLPWETLRTMFGPGVQITADSSINGLTGFQMLLGQSGFSSAHPSVRWLGLLWSILPLFGLLIGVRWLHSLAFGSCWRRQA